MKDSSSDEKLYRFISDPGHKETLSGRVQAACVTCRRKKIKCSGDVPCTTCEEKGIVCEGLLERKRPKKNQDRRSRASSVRGERRSSQGARSDDSTVGSKRNSFDYSFNKIEQNEDVLRRPTAHLRELGAENSFDSGYASSAQPKEDCTASQLRQLETTFPFNYDLASCDISSCDNVPAISPRANARQDWSLVSRSTLSSIPTTEVAGSDISLSANPISTAISPEPTHWPDPGDQPTLWDDGCTSIQAATKLFSAAEALEEQALSLRRLASHRETEFAEETRRQTITFPIYFEGTASQPFPADPSPSPYDDLSLMLGDHPAPSGLTPIPLEFNSWWDINSRFSSTLGYQRSTNSASAADPTDSRWPYVSSPYDMQSTTVVSQEQANELIRPEVPAPDRRHSTPSNRAQPRNAYGRLYPWPE